MKVKIKSLIKFFLLRLGYNISRVTDSKATDSKKPVPNFSYHSTLSRLFEKGQKIVIFDIGAHHGESALKFSQIFDNSEIHSFEPFPQSFVALQRLNLPNVKAYHCGFSDKTQKEKFHANVFDYTNSLLPFSNNLRMDIWGENDVKEIGQIECDFFTIDDFMKNNNIPVVDFMKIDVQGAEYKVFEGARKALSEKRIKAIQMEVNITDLYEGQKSMGYYVNLLEGYGYRIKNFFDFEYFTGDDLFYFDMLLVAK